MTDLKELKVGYLKIILSEPVIGLMYNKIDGKFIEVYEVNRINNTIRFRNVYDDKEGCSSFSKIKLHVLVINYEKRNYPLNKSQWIMNKKNLFKNTLFYFKGNGPVRVWNLTLEQQAELMLMYKNK